MTIPNMPGLIDVIIAPNQRRHLEGLLAPLQVQLVRIDATPWFRPPDAPAPYVMGWAHGAAPGTITWNRITVAALRHALGVTAGTLAADIGVTTRAVNLWEHPEGKRLPAEEASMALDYMYVRLTLEQHERFDGYVLNSAA